MFTTCLAYGGMASGISRAADAWQATLAKSRPELEEMLSHCVSLAGTIRALHKRGFQELFRNTMFPAQAAGAAMLQLQKETEEAFLHAERACQTALAEGFAIDGLARFRKAHADLIEEGKFLADNWPMFTAEELEQSQAEYDRGEVVDGEELFRELASNLH